MKHTNIFYFSDWLPCQTGFVLVSRCLLELRILLVLDEECQIEYLLPSRTTTECCENEFASVRTKCGEMNPGPLRVKEALRVDAVCQSVTPPRGSNYKDTLAITALNLRDLQNMSKEQDSEGVPALSLEDISIGCEEHSGYARNSKKVSFFFLILNYSQLFPDLYHIGGWLARQATLSKKFCDCANCTNFLSNMDKPQKYFYTEFTRRLTHGSLRMISVELDELVEAAEHFYLAASDQVQGKPKPNQLLAQAFIDHPQHKSVLLLVPDCHRTELAFFILCKFFMSRLARKWKDDQILAKSKVVINYAGKSSLMNTMASKRPALNKQAEPGKCFFKNTYGENKKKII